MTANTTSMEHFGEALRCERQRRSVTLEDISQTTKVTVRSLKALESEAFDQLPGGILSKGIVRSYVRYLGLDENEWVKRFLDASGQNKQEDPARDKDWVSFALNVSTTRARQVTDTKLRWAGVVALLLLLGGLGWVVWGYVHQRMTAVSASTTPTYATSFTMSVRTPAAPPEAVPAKKSHRRSKSHSLR